MVAPLLFGPTQQRERRGRRGTATDRDGHDDDRTGEEAPSLPK